MNQQSPLIGHERHDELLVARLYGGDVTERDRELALDQIAACQECATLFADLGAVADATRLLPVPPRPRDFALTEADAERLGRRGFASRLAGWFGGRPGEGLGRLGVRRSMGGVLTAVGLVGVLLVGTSGLLHTTSHSATDQLAARYAPSAASAAEQSALPTPAQVPAPAATAGPAGSTVEGAGTKALATPEAPETGAAATAATTVAPATPAPATAAPTAIAAPSATSGGGTTIDQTTSGGASAGGGSPETANPPSQFGMANGSTPAPPSYGPAETAAVPGGSSPDAGQLATLTFALALLLGLALLVGPALLRAASRRFGR